MTFFTDMLLLLFFAQLRNGGSREGNGCTVVELAFWKAKKLLRIFQRSDFVQKLTLLVKVGLGWIKFGLVCL